jgi:prephenate dehydrogenase
MSEADSALAGAGFERIAIVGLGLIGGSIALATRRARSATAIAAVDRADVLRKALERGAVDVASERLDIVAGADLVILAAPVQQNVELVRQVSRHVSAATIVTDVGSTKRVMVEAARGLGGSLTFVGGHPIAGAASCGIDLATADLFSGRRWVLTPDGGTPHEALARLCAFVRTLGAEPHVMSAAEHDRVLAFTSHLPQLAASALMRVAGEGAGDAGLALAGPGLVDTTRLADSSFEMWRDICLTNADNIRAALDELIGALDHLRAHVAAPRPLEQIFGEAQIWRERVCAAARPRVPQSGSTSQSA